MMIRPSELDWKIYQEVLGNHPVYKIAESYSIEQEKVLEIYFNCLQWKELEEGTPVYNYSRRRYRKK